MRCEVPQKIAASHRDGQLFVTLAGRLAGFVAIHCKRFGQSYA